MAASDCGDFDALSLTCVCNFELFNMLVYER
jgi:hypothetical protein